MRRYTEDDEELESVNTFETPGRKLSPEIWASLKDRIEEELGEFLLSLVDEEFVDSLGSEDDQEINEVLWAVTAEVAQENLASFEAEEGENEDAEEAEHEAAEAKAEADEEIAEVEGDEEGYEAAEEEEEEAEESEENSEFGWGHGSAEEEEELEEAVKLGLSDEQILKMFERAKK